MRARTGTAHRADTTDIGPDPGSLSTVLHALDDAPHAQADAERSWHPWGAEPVATRRRRRLLAGALAGADALALIVAALATALVHGGFGASPLLAVLLSVGALAATGMYRQHEVRPGQSTPDELLGIALAVTLGSWLASLLGHPAGSLVVFLLCGVVGVAGARAVARYVCRRRPWYWQRTIIVGAGVVGRLVAEKYRKHPEFGVRVVGFVDGDPLPGLHRAAELPVLGGLAELPEIIRRHAIERAVVAFSRDEHAAVVSVLSAMRSADVHLDIVPRYFDLMGPSATLHQLEGVGIVGLPPARPSSIGLIGKRAFDVVVSAGLLLALAPLLIVLAALIRIDSRGPVTYRGRRVGRGGREIELLKFRTMHPDAERRLAQLLADEGARKEFEETHKITADPRVTRIGGFLRRTSLDELPQLVNVLRGDMSLVGPRPVTRSEWDLRFGDCAPEDAPVAGYWLIDDLRPGLTGYWQINGRSAMSFTERMRMDMAYLSSWSLRLDLLILAKTVRAVASRDGAY
jgi:exopolysaccharide biosynthesis polyprenyl glycosylphosphotransferase